MISATFDAAAFATGGNTTPGVSFGDNFWSMFDRYHAVAESYEFEQASPALSTATPDPA